MLNRWVIDTLAYKAVIDKKPQYKIQKYFNNLKYQFFPQIHYHNDEKKLLEFKSFSIDDIKALLYHNDIGYKKENKKLFIKRFYRLPLLLFPKEILKVGLINDEDKLRSILYEEPDGNNININL